MDWQSHFKQRNQETSRFGAAIVQAEDIEAINRYIVNGSAKTKEAIKIRDEWIRWHDNLGFFAKNFDGGTYDQARNIRNRYNIANATTKDEKEFVQQVQQQGLSSEEMQGGTKRVLSSGQYETPDAPLVPTSFKLGVGVTLGTLAAGYIAWKLYVPDIRGLLRKV